MKDLIIIAKYEIPIILQPYKSYERCNMLLNKMENYLTMYTNFMMHKSIDWYDTENNNKLICLMGNIESHLINCYEYVKCMKHMLNKNADHEKETLIENLKAYIITQHSL